MPGFSSSWAGLKGSKSCGSPPWQGKAPWAAKQDVSIQLPGGCELMGAALSCCQEGDTLVQQHCCQMMGSHWKGQRSTQSKEAVWLFPVQGGSQGLPDSSAPIQRQWCERRGQGASPLLLLCVWDEDARATRWGPATMRAEWGQLPICPHPSPHPVSLGMATSQRDGTDPGCRTTTWHLALDATQ